MMRSPQPEKINLKRLQVMVFDYLEYYDDKDKLAISRPAALLGNPTYLSGMTPSCNVDAAYRKTQFFYICFKATNASHPYDNRLLNTET